MHGIHPFPYDRLQRLSSEQAALLDRTSSWLAGRSSWRCNALEPILGHSLALSAREIWPGREGRRLGEGSLLLRLEHVGSGRAALVEVDAPLALELVWTTLTGSLDASIAAPRALDQVEQGVLLYLAARVLWSLWGTEAPFRVAGLGLEQDLSEGEAGGVTVHLTLSAGAIFGHAWLHLQPALGADLSPPRSIPSAGSGPDRLEWIPAALHVAIGRVELSLAQWRTLRPGDAVILDELWTAPHPGAPVAGPVRLRLPRGRPRWRGSLDHEGTITLVGSLAPAQEVRIMEPADDTRPEALSELLEELPVELGVELGRVALTAREALALRPGQTLRLGRRPGDPVDLRVGPKLVGRGELVQIEGEIGVLLRELFAG